MAEEVVIVETPFHPVKWGSFIVRGLIALLIGFLVLIWTGIAVQVVVTLIGILIIIVAILALILALKSPTGVSRSSVMLFVAGVLGLLVGIAAILYRWIAAEALTVIFAFLMLFIGFIDLSIAVYHPEYTKHRFLLGVSGAFSVILGGVFFLLPAFGALVLVTVYLGIFAIIYGVLSIVIGMKVRGKKKKVTTG
jgi:uncharacterized membrane protein HdeD (DUF308 family)